MECQDAQILVTHLLSAAALIMCINGGVCEGGAGGVKDCQGSKVVSLDF